MQHFTRFPGPTFVCGADATGARNSLLDSDTGKTTCPRCLASEAWQHAVDQDRAATEVEHQVTYLTGGRTGERWTAVCSCGTRFESSHNAHLRRAIARHVTPAPAKCPNVTPMPGVDVRGHLRYSTCPECGGYLAVLASGRFRTHKPVFKPGDPRIAAAVRAAQANA
jgi:hypothetical protein